jgi:hypothetical protein
MASSSLKLPIEKGGYFIICHAGSVDYGFIKRAELVFQTNSGNNYHDEMHSEVFKKWFIELVRSLEEGSITVMGMISI